MFVNIYRNPLYVSQLLSDLLKDSSQNCGSDLTSCRMYEEKDHDYYLMSVPGYKKVYDKDYKYNFGRPVKLSHGKDILILTYGSMVSQCLGVSKLLN